MHLHHLFSAIKTHVQDEEDKRKMYRMLRYLIRNREEISLPNEFCALLIYRDEISHFMQEMEFAKDDVEAFLDFFWSIDPRLVEKIAEKESQENNNTILGVLRTGIITGLGVMIFKLGVVWAWRTQYMALMEDGSGGTLHGVNATLDAL